MTFSGHVTQLLFHWHHMLPLVLVQHAATGINVCHMILTAT